jgi:hypothetical protein
MSRPFRARGAPYDRLVAHGRGPGPAWAIFATDCAAKSVFLEACACSGLVIVLGCRPGGQLLQSFGQHFKLFVCAEFVESVNADLNRSGVVVGYIVDVFGFAHDHLCSVFVPHQTLVALHLAARIWLLAQLSVSDCELVHTLLLKNEASTARWVQWQGPRTAAGVLPLSAWPLPYARVSFRETAAPFQRGEFDKVTGLRFGLRYGYGSRDGYGVTLRYGCLYKTPVTVTRRNPLLTAASL